MRGAEPSQVVLFSFVDIEQRVPLDHPLRAMRALIDPILADLSPRFATIYDVMGRPSIPPERLLRALLLQVLYTIRSERQLVEQIDYNLLFRWFVGLGMDEPVWSATTFTKNRERLFAGDIADGLLAGVVGTAEARGLLSKEHFSVDGTLLEAWASQKSFRPKDAPPSPGDDDDPKNPTVNFRGERRTNATHASTTDPDARLAKKGRGQGAKLAYQASMLIDNRHGLVVQTVVGPADGGPTEVQQGIELVQGLPARRRRRTIGADKGYQDPLFLEAVRAAHCTPHVAQEATDPKQYLDERTLRHPGHAVSQRCRKKIEEGYGWGKMYGLLRKLRHRGRERVGWIFTFTMAAYNLVRLRTLEATTA